LKFGLLDFAGNPYIGVYCRVSDRYGILPDVYSSAKTSIENGLGVEVVVSYVSESAVVGAMCAMSNAGVVVPALATPEEIALLEKHMNVCVINDKLNACGNNILMNSKHALLNPELGKKTAKQIHDVLGVETMYGTIAGVKTVGMCALINDSVMLVHPKIKPEEKKKLKDFFGVKIFECTANFGVPYVGACTLMNAHGALIGSKSTPVELMKIQEALLSP